MTAHDTLTVRWRTRRGGLQDGLRTKRQIDITSNPDGMCLAAVL